MYLHRLKIKIRKYSYAKSAEVLHQERHFHILKFNYANLLKKTTKKVLLCVKRNKWLILFKRQRAFISALAKTNILRKNAGTILYIIHV